MNFYDVIKNFSYNLLKQRYGGFGIQFCQSQSNFWWGYKNTKVRSLVLTKALKLWKVWWMIQNDTFCWQINRDFWVTWRKNKHCSFTYWNKLGFLFFCRHVLKPGHTQKKRFSVQILFCSSHKTIILLQGIWNIPQKLYELP